MPKIENKGPYNKVGLVEQTERYSLWHWHMSYHADKSVLSTLGL